MRATRKIARERRDAHKRAGHHWNYPAVEEDVLLDAYGVTRDERRISYYRARWEQAPPAAG